jgi:hypothetical protein
MLRGLSKFRTVGALKYVYCKACAYILLFSFTISCIVAISCNVQHYERAYVALWTCRAPVGAVLVLFTDSLASTSNLFWALLLSLWLRKVELLIYSVFLVPSSHVISGFILALWFGKVEYLHASVSLTPCCFRSYSCLLAWINGIVYF